MTSERKRLAIGKSHHFEVGFVTGLMIGVLIGHLLTVFILCCVPIGS